MRGRTIEFTPELRPLPRPNRNWSNLKRKTQQRTATKNGDGVPVDFSKYTPDKYLLSWATIVCGVEPVYNGFYIHPAHSRLINWNSNAWLNRTLLESYRSFILAENYVEHIQDQDLSKGRILDAVAWIHEFPDPLLPKSKKVPTVFVDILVATNRKNHPILIKKIENGEVGALSMGTYISHFQCSRCGIICRDGKDDPCIHVADQLGNMFRGKDDLKHVTAELCGIPGKKGSCVFQEASWVGTPAFSPAVKHGIIKEGSIQGKPLKAYVPNYRSSRG